MNWKLSVILLTLSVIACGAPAGSLTLSEKSDVSPIAESVNKDTAMPTEVSTDVNMTVCNSGGLNVRPSAGDLSASIRQLTDGYPVTVRKPATITDDMGMWYELVDGGWVNARYLCEAK